jgi:agmatine deiminase
MMKRPISAFALLAFTGLLLGAGCATGAGEEDAIALGHSALIDANGRKVLPNWATDEEAAIERVAPAPRARSEHAPASGFRVPAEYEPVSTVVMTWAGHPDVLSGISSAAAAAGADVWMVGGPGSMPGVAADKYRALSLGFDSIWARDYGPVGINEASRTLGIVDTTYRHHAVRHNDDAMSCRLADTFGVDCHTTSLILDGGNFMSDGKGNAYLTERVYDWNNTMSREQVDELLKTYLGASKIHILPYAKNAQGEPADGTGHMDMMAKLVADCKVIVAQTSNDPFKTVTDQIADYFANNDCAEGRHFEVTRVKGWLDGRTWYTYSNSLIVNKSVIIPFYNDRTKNDEAVRAYKSALPDYNIVGVLSESTIVQGGSIHCITKEIPVVTPR